LIDEALAREVREETGLELLESPRLAFVAQVDDLVDGSLATMWTFEASWTGELAPSDPDGHVLEAALVPVADATTRLEEASWHWPTVRYFRGEIKPGSLLLERCNAEASVKRSLERA
jgi:ADP-ribose pyrophosphatase YjhB (NUDIX family)